MTVIPRAAISEMSNRNANGVRAIHGSLLSARKLP